jgi:hypothetical protein
MFRRSKECNVAGRLVGLLAHGYCKITMCDHDKVQGSTLPLFIAGFIRERQLQRVEAQRYLSSASECGIMNERTSCFDDSTVVLKKFMFGLPTISPRKPLSHVSKNL